MYNLVFIMIYYTQDAIFSEVHLINWLIEKNKHKQ